MKPAADCEPVNAVAERSRCGGQRPQTSFPLMTTVHGLAPELTDVRVTSFRINPDFPQAGQVGIIGTFRCVIAGLIILKGCTLHRGLNGIRITAPNDYRVLLINGTLRNRLARRAHAAFKIALGEQGQQPSGPPGRGVPESVRRLPKGPAGEGHLNATTEKRCLARALASNARAGRGDA